MSAKRPSWYAMLTRLRWDLMDRFERRQYLYWFIWQIPGLFGNMLRERFLAKRMAKAGKNLTVMAGCRFRSLELLEVGDNVTIGYDNFLQARGGLSIGNNVILGPGVRIWSVNHDYSDTDTVVLEQGQTEKPVVIGNDVFVGASAFISPGVTLPNNCVVCAGAVVGVKAYRPLSVLAGNPARVIGFRGGEAPSDVSQAV